MNRDLGLRSARLEDRYSVWVWANDPGSRAASRAGAGAPISWATHVAWWASRVPSANALVLMAETPDGQPVGVIRFDTETSWLEARLSYTVAPEVRGQGVGAWLVEAGLQELHRRRPDVVVLAEVREANQASLAVFRRLRWREAAPDQGWVRFQSPESVR